MILMQKLFVLSLLVIILVISFRNEYFNDDTSPRLFNPIIIVEAYRVKSTTDPSFECSGCARTRLIGCFHGQCSYRCYRSCTNGTNVVIEAHRFVLEGQRRRRRKRYVN
ncbi:uncharacterized protein LOC113793505 [Dermatophagoides pteronyssinus]|uniref:Uncharacterized protein n=2 Tax=Dermatophagoides pteronyssinus TaxID=6956 RepID=A0ABQ8IUY7_DERPT|nr:uncharacterized protein LOC113793505 [Dermatophagoides pteronyssinus]KAH9414130.1 hypothetical protein DERP_012609 [Dermatophagoides pteronyssinus]